MDGETRLYSMKEVRARIGVSKNTLEGILRSDPDFKTIRIGRRRLMSDSALRTWIQAQEAKTA